MVSSGTRQTTGAAPTHAGRIELGGAIVQDPRLPMRSHDKVVPRARYGEKAVNALIVAIATSAAAGGLLRFAHHAAGYSVVPLVPAAFDGGSAAWSGGAALVALAGAVGFAIAGMYAKPRSVGYLVSGLGMVIAAVAMITVTVSVSPDGAPEIPPDGGRLVPWALAVVPFGVACRFVRNAWAAAYEDAFAKERFQSALWALAAGAVAFVGVELLFGAGIARL
jgi:hypothetical protein